MDTGSAKRRVRFTRQRYKLSFTIILDISQYDTFKAWYESTLAFGVKDFLFVHPITKLQKAYYFEKPPQFSAIGPIHFQLTMELEES